MSQSIRCLLGCASAVVISSCLPAIVYAQSRLPAATGSSERAAFQAQGFPLGGFRVYPALRLSSYYDDNISRIENKPTGDAAVVTEPSLSLASSWSSHQLNANAFLRDTRMFRRTEQNRDEFGLSGNGRLDVMRTTTVRADAGYSRLAEQRGTPGDLFLTRRTVQYSVLTGTAGIAHKFNRVGVDFDATRTTYRYDDIVSGDTRFDQSFRNRDSDNVTGRLSYQYSTITSFFVQASASKIRYERTSNNRSSDGFTALGGVRFELTRLLRGEIGVGYLKQDFKNPLYRSFTGANYNASLTYRPTELTTLTLKADRRMSDSSLANVAGVLSSQIGLGLDHELLRNLELQANGTYTQYAYRGINRTDNRYDISVGARYKLSRYVSAALSGDRIQQDSGDVLGRSYKSNRVTLSLILAP